MGPETMRWEAIRLCDSFPHDSLDLLICKMFLLQTSSSGVGNIAGGFIYTLYAGITVGGVWGTIEGTEDLMLVMCKASMITQSCVSDTSIIIFKNFLLLI